MRFLPDLKEQLQQRDLHKHVTDAQQDTSEAVGKNLTPVLTHCWCKQSLIKRHYLQPGQPMLTHMAWPEWPAGTQYTMRPDCNAPWQGTHPPAKTAKSGAVRSGRQSVQCRGPAGPPAVCGAPAEAAGRGSCAQAMQRMRFTGNPLRRHGRKGETNNGIPVRHSKTAVLITLRRRKTLARARGRRSPPPRR